MYITQKIDPANLIPLQREGNSESTVPITTIKLFLVYAAHLLEPSHDLLNRVFLIQVLLKIAEGKQLSFCHQFLTEFLISTEGNP